MARAILISYSGYPYTPSSLLPDNGLANLAGALVAAGHYAMVLDYGTVDTMRLLVPQDIRRHLHRVYDRLQSREGRSAGGFRRLWGLLKLRSLDRHLARHRRLEAERIAEELGNLVSSQKPDFVGFKLWNGDGFDGSVAMAESLKRRFPALKVYAGGPHVDFFRGLIYERTRAFDGLIFGEAEETILQLADHASGNGSLDFPNLITPDGIERPMFRIDDLNRLPMPVYDEAVYPAMRGDQKIKIVVLDESRGCPYGCSFCVQPVKSGHIRRVKGADRIVGEMRTLSHRHGIRAFRFAGSSTPADLMREVATRILGEGLDVTYCSYGHTREFKAEDANLLKRSGLFGLLFGIESGSQAVLDKMHKPTTLEGIRQAVISARKAGIFVVGSVIAPAPGDSPQTLNETFDLLTELRPDSVFIQFPGVYPGTSWALHPERYGFRLDKRTYARRIMNYKIKTLFPPSFWSPLPYRLDGMSFRRFARITESFATRLEGEGIVTQLTDDIALVGHVLGLDPRTMKKTTSEAMWAGDWETMADLVVDFNRRMNAGNQ